ncbi:hypothetical protein ACFL6U_24365, partial [Planctomycetota bacterium]
MSSNTGTTLLLILSVYCLPVLTCAKSVLAKDDAAVSAHQTVNVAGFGAIPDDNKDDTRAVKAALNACKEQKSAALVFPKGRYDFFPTFASERYCFVSNNDEGLKRIAFPMYNVQKLTVDGQGSEFMFHGFINPFVVDHAAEIRFENFSIDYSRPFHSEGIILGFDDEGMDLEIREGFPFKVHRGTLLFTDGQKNTGPLTTVSKENVFGSSHMLEYDTQKRETAYMVRDYYFSEITGYPAKRLGGRKVRVLVPGLKGTVGNTMAFGPNHRNYPGFVLSDSQEITFHKITIHHAGGMGILGQRCHNII